MRAGRLALLLLLPAAAAGPALAQQAALEPLVEPFRVDPAAGQLALVDIDGDGRKEILRVRGDRVQLDDGAAGIKNLEIPGTASIWTVVDIDRDGRDEFLVLRDGEELVKLEMVADRLAWSAPLVQGLGGNLPQGKRPADFARDLDHDGLPDLVVPDGGRLRLYFGSEGGFRPGPDLGVVSRLSLRDRGGRGLLDRTSREIVVPRISMQELNGDGLPDLQVSDGTSIRQYIGTSSGLPPEPTVTVDLKAFEEKLPEIKFDPSNIAGLSKYAVFEEWADLNLDGAQDLIVLWGGVVLIYLGGPEGVELRRPYDQLPTRGNVFYAYAAPVDADPVPDLVLLRIEDVSLARALSWLAFSFSIQFDMLAYKGLGNGRFERRPMKESKSLKIDSPSIKSLFDNRSQADSMRRTIVRLADFDGDGRKTDLALLSDQGELSGWRDLVADPAFLDEVTRIFLTDLLKRERVLELDVQTIFGWFLGRASLLVSLTEGRTPFFRLAAPTGWAVPHAMTVADVDGDGRDEIVALRLSLNPPEEGGGPVLLGRVVDPDGGAP